MSSSFPNLLYLGDVPVESSYHGSALLYRLLDGYPEARLLIVEGDCLVSESHRRLRNVRYEVLRIGSKRLLRTRLGSFYSSWLFRRSASRWAQIEPLLHGFEPEAVVSVSHSYSWVTAAEFASRRNLPLHLICHDDWPRLAGMPRAAMAELDRVFGRIYRQAAGRYCVSPYMREAYQARYGVDAIVLYPSRAPDCAAHAAPPARLAEPCANPTIAFGGTINSPGLATVLRGMAQVLRELGGRLLLFGPLTSADARLSGLDLPNIALRGLVSSNELIGRLREEADALFLPMSFAPADKPGVETNFPSKLTDYTAAALPLIVQGPSYASGVRWAQQNQGVAEIVTSQDPGVLLEAVKRLASNTSHRLSLASRAHEVGGRYFDAQDAQETFFRFLARLEAKPAGPAH